MFEIRSEDKILIACISSDSERFEQIRRLLDSGIDWDYLIRSAQRHRVMPLVYQILNKRFAENVPRLFFNRIKEAYQDSIKVNLMLTGELLKLLKLFADNHIAAIPYKGPALAQSLYGDVSLRQFGDLDILAHKNDVLKIKELLINAGGRPELDLTASQEVEYLNSHNEYAFFCNKARIYVEVHWEVTERFFTFPLDAERLWDRLVCVHLAGRQVLTLSPEDSLLILCAHGTKHLWERLGWICDVARLIDVNQDLKWEEAFEHATRLGSERMLFLGLFLANDLLGARLPEEVSQRMLADKSVRRLASEIRQRLFRPGNDSPGIIESALFHLKARERARDRIKYLLRLALQTTVNDWLFLPLPRPLFFLYYPLRPIRLALKYGANLLKRIQAQRLE